MSPEARPEARPDDLFLPDFCGIRTVFAVVLGGELLACVLVLAQPAAVAGAWVTWRQLALVSLFVQWVALSSTAVLCTGRAILARLSNVAAGIASYAVILLITAGLSALSLRLVIGADTSVELGGASGAHPSGWGVGASATFVLRNLGVSAIVAAVALRYFYVQHQWKANLESETRSRIQALQSRIRPHFLFNSMNTIASLTRTDPPLAEQVTEDLADLFRVSLSDASVPVTLGRELEVCRQYLRIEQLRLGERLRARFEVEALPGDARIPALTLQPLVENAVYHGVEPAAGGGEVHVHGEREDERLRIVIENTMPAGGVRTREGHQMALDNVAQRIGVFYADDARLYAEEHVGRYRLVLELPYQRSTTS